MQCRDAQELFSDYIEGLMDKALAVSFENHMAGCQQCSADVQQMRSLWSSLQEIPREEAPAFFHENIMSRIAQEQTAAQEKAARKRALWDWKALLKPRTFALGAASLALVLACAEVVQTQRASLGPIGWVTSLVRPIATPELELGMQSASWEPNAQGGGTLILELKAKPSANAQANAFYFKIVQKGIEEPLRQGTVASDQSVTVRVPLDKEPQEGQLSLNLSASENAPTGKAIPLTLNASEAR